MTPAGTSNELDVQNGWEEKHKKKKHKGHKERRTGKIRGAFSRMHRALDGWMLARAPASPVQGLHHHGPRYFDFPYFCTKCVALRNLDLLIKTGWSVIFPVFC